MKKATLDPVSVLAVIEQQMELFADCDARLQEMNSQMDKEILEIRRRYAGNLTALQEKKDASFNQIEAYAIEHSPLLFSIRKSFKTKYGTLGFRTGKPRFILANGASWARITELLKSSLPGYIRIVHEPAKDKLLADFNLPEVNKLAPALGLSVTQDESFYIDLKK